MFGSAGLLAGAGAAAAWADNRYLRLAAQTLARSAMPPAPMTERPFARPEDWAAKLIDAAEGQIGQTVRYDGSYVRLSYPDGDIPRQVGVCTDVVIRAYRDAFGFDLQKAVHEDMKRSFTSYPKIWGLSRPDRNIDHRRVPNLERFFLRHEASLPISANGADYRPGDLVSQRLPGNLPHIAIVTHRPSADGKRAMIVHNIGAGTRLEDRLFEFKIVGHFRYRPNAA